MGPSSYIRSVIDRNVVMRLMTVLILMTVLGPSYILCLPQGTTNLSTEIIQETEYF